MAHSLANHSDVQKASMKVFLLAELTGKDSEMDTL